MKTLLLLLLVTTCSFGQVKIYVTNGCMTFYNSSSLGACVQLDKIVSIDVNSANTQITIKRYDNEVTYTASNVRNANNVPYSSSAMVVRDSLNAQIFNSLKTTGNINITQSYVTVKNDQLDGETSSITYNANTIKYISVMGVTTSDQYTISDGITTKDYTGFGYSIGNGFGLITNTIVVTRLTGTIKIATY
jgi:hypothetical protein